MLYIIYLFSKTLLFVTCLNQIEILVNESTEMRHTVLAFLYSVRSLYGDVLYLEFSIVKLIDQGTTI